MNLSKFNDEKEKVQHGKIIWDSIVRRLKINEATVVVALSGENKELDSKTIEYLPFFVERKKAERVEILVSDEKIKKILLKKKYSFLFDVTVVSKENLCAIYDYYCFAFNLDNIAFTFLNQCPYNLMGRILDETDITEDEAVCLGVYWLREIQEKVTDV